MTKIQFLIVSSYSSCLSIMMLISHKIIKKIISKSYIVINKMFLCVYIIAQ